METVIDVRNEFAPLSAVIVGLGSTFATGAELVSNCPTMEKAIRDGLLPDLNTSAGLDNVRRRLDRELGIFKDKLLNAGVKVLRPQAIATQEQMFARDPLIVIGDNVIRASFRTPTRVSEFIGVQPHIGENFLTTPEGVFLEGGDVIPDGNTVFVGIGGQRSNNQSIEFLEKAFPGKEIRPLELKNTDQGEDVLHLDCALGILNESYALVYPEGFKDPRKVLHALKGRQAIVVNRDEQMNFATNFFMLDRQTVFSRPTVPRVNNILRRLGFKVLEVAMPTVELFGGSFRCATHPLSREV